MSIGERDAQISSATEGFQPGDIWTLCKRLTVQASRRIEDVSTQTQITIEGDKEIVKSSQNGIPNKINGRFGKSENYPSPVKNNSNRLSSNCILYTTYDEVIFSAKEFSPNSSSSSSVTSLPVSWDDIGGLHSAKVAITDVFQLPVVFRRLFQLSPIRMPRAILLYGPPGCGKTMLAQAAATECGLAFISVRG